MSTTPNTAWLESANDSFEEMLQEANWTACEAIMADVKEAGFQKEYEDMHKRYTHERFMDK